MFTKRIWIVVSVMMIALLALTACANPTAAPTAAPVEPEVPVATEAPVETEAPVVTEAPVEPLSVGLLLVGPANDAGWSQAHFDSMAYVQEKLPGTELLYLENVYTGSTAHTMTPSELAADMAAKGAKVVIFNSDDQKDHAIKFAQENPDIFVIHASGDTAWKEGKNYVDLPNLKNIMGRMEYGKMIAGCAAALTSQTGKIGFLGPLINDETRRFAASSYLGAKYCWENYLGKDPAELEFKVTWIGFWFNIPGVTLDPTQVADDFFNTGYDVIISSIDTTEALTEAKKFAAEGKQVLGGYLMTMPALARARMMSAWALSTSTGVLPTSLRSSLPWMAPGLPRLNWLDRIGLTSITVIHPRLVSTRALPFQLPTQPSLISSLPNSALA